MTTYGHTRAHDNIVPRALRATRHKNPLAPRVGSLLNGQLKMLDMVHTEKLY